MTVIHYIGSSALVILLAMLIVNLIHMRRLEVKSVVGYVLMTIVILLMLLRT